VMPMVKKTYTRGVADSRGGKQKSTRWGLYDKLDQQGVAIFYLKSDAEKAKKHLNKTSDKGKAFIVEKLVFDD